MMDKITVLLLSSGKKVSMREMLIKDQTAAAAMISKQSQGNQAAQSIEMVQNLTRLLIVKIDGKSVKQSELIKLDDYFNVSEFRQVTKYVEGLLEEPNPPLVQFENSTGEELPG